MKKEEALKYIEDKGDSTFVVRTEEENKIFLENYARQEIEKADSAKIKDIHTKYDDDIFEVTGIRREPDKHGRTYEFNKGLLKEFKIKADKLTAYETEIASLKKQIADGTGDKKTLEDLQAVQKAYKELEDTKTKEITELRSEYDKFKVKAEITSALSGMTFKKNIPESALKALTDQIINDLSTIAAYQDGKLVFLENGVPKRNAHNALNPYTAKELLEERMKDIRDVARKADGGPDLGKEIVKEYDKGKLTKVVMLLPDTVKTKEDLSRHLISAGLLRNSEEYFLAYKEYSASLPTR